MNDKTQIVTGEWIVKDCRHSKRREYHSVSLGTTPISSTKTKRWTPRVCAPLFLLYLAPTSRGVSPFVTTYLPVFVVLYWTLSRVCDDQLFWVTPKVPFFVRMRHVDDDFLILFHTKCLLRIPVGIVVIFGTKRGYPNVIKDRLLGVKYLLKLKHYYRTLWGKTDKTEEYLSLLWDVKVWQLIFENLHLECINPK